MLQGKHQVNHPQNSSNQILQKSWLLWNQQQTKIWQKVWFQFLKSFIPLPGQWPVLADTHQCHVTYHPNPAPTRSEIWRQRTPGPMGRFFFKTMQWYGLGKEAAQRPFSILGNVYLYWKYHMYYRIFVCYICIQNYIMHILSSLAPMRQNCWKLRTKQVTHLQFPGFLGLCWLKDGIQFCRK